MFLAALGFIELLFFGLFFLALVIGVTFDRRGIEDPKWWIIGVAFIIALVWFWGDFTFFSTEEGKVNLWEVVRSWTFWAPAFTYLGIGLVYSILEFVLDVRRSARIYKQKWSEFLEGSSNIWDEKDEKKTRRLKNRDILEKATTSSDEEDRIKAQSVVESFVRADRYGHRIIVPQVADGGLSITPVVDKGELTEHVSAWTFLWPAYAISLILGDLLTEFFRVVTDMLVSMSGRFVRFQFADVFKF